MRNSLLASLVAVMAFAPPFAEAQTKASPRAAPEAEASDEEAEGEGGTEVEGAEVADQPIRMTRPPPTAGGRESAPGEVHTVVRGDTLWDLSQRYLGSPWYWPKVWSYNPEIANPHWIYPGNLVRFFAAGEEVPSRVEVGQPAGEIPEDVQGAEMLPSGEGDVQVVGKIGYTLKPTRVIRDGFVTPKELQEAGTLTGAFEDHVMLATPDLVYLSFKRKGEVRVGDRFVVFHTESEIRHPKDNQLHGYLTRLLGTVRVTAVTDQHVKAQIVETWEPISRGDLVGPHTERIGGVLQPRPNEREVKGTVISSLVPSLAMLGEFHTVVLDKGTKDGVQPGNTFTILGRGQPGPALGSQDAAKSLPWEDIGTCIAVEVRDSASTCAVVRSLREFSPGDPAEMRTGRSGSGPVSRR